MTESRRRPDPLSWGRGERVLELFLEPTCPYSVRAFNKMHDLLAVAGAERITVKLRLHSQPWHMYSGVIVRCVLAASMLEGGRNDAWRVLKAVGDNREAFEFEGHCRGANMDATPNDIIRRIEDHSGLALAAAFELPELVAEIKRHTRLARQNGVHVSPTFMIDGLIQPDMGSGDPVEDWARQLLA